MEAPEALGTSLKTVISRFQELKSNPTQLLEVDGETASLNSMDAALASVGISLKDASGQFRDLDEVIFELSKIWDTLDRNTQRWIANTAAGSRQQSRFISLLSDSERLQELYTAALDSEDAALVQYSKSLDSMESKLNQLSTSFQQFYMQIFNGETLKAAVEYLTQFVDKLNEIGPVGAIAIVGSLISALSSIGMAMSTKIAAAYKTSKEYLDGRKAEIQVIGDSWWDGFVANFVPKVQAATNQAVQVIQNAQNQINTTNTTGTPHLRRSGLNDGKAASESKQFNEALEGTSEGAARAASKIDLVAGALNKFAPAVSLASTYLFSTVDASNKASVAISHLASTAQIAVGAAQVYSGNPMGILTILSGINQIIGAVEFANEKISRLKKNAESANITRAESKSNLTTLDSTYKKYIRLRDAQYESNEAYDEWIKYNQQIINDYPQLATTYDSQGNLVVDLAGKYDSLRESANAAYKAQKKNSQAADVELASQSAYKFSVFGMAAANEKAGSNILSKIGTATNQEDARKLLFSAFGVEGAAYDNGEDYWNGNLSIDEIASGLYQDQAMRNEKFLRELLVSADPGQYWEDTDSQVKEFAEVLGLSLDDILNIGNQYTQILKSGSQTLYKDATTNIEEAVNELDGSYSDIQKSVIQSYLQNQLTTLYTAGELTTEKFSQLYDTSKIDGIVSSAGNDLFTKFDQETIDKAQEISNTSAQLSYNQYNHLDKKLKDALDQIYNITEETFSEPIDNITTQITSLEGNAGQVWASSNTTWVKPLLQSLPKNVLSYVKDIFSELDKLSPEGRNEEEISSIIDQYTNLLWALSNSDIDAGTLATLLSDADLTTRSGWQAFLNALTASGKAGAEIAAQFENVPNMISVSMADAQQGLNSLQTAMTSAADIIKDLQGSDSEKKLAAYKTLNNLLPDYSSEIMALANGEDLTGEITQKVYAAYIEKIKTDLQNIVDTLRESGVTDEEEKELQSIEVLIASFDNEIAEAAGVRATNIVSLVMSLVDDILGRKTSSLSRNDYNAINTLAEAGNVFAQDIIDNMLEQTSSDTWSVKSSVSTRDWADAISGLVDSVEEPGIELVTNLKNTSEQKWEKAIHDADFSNFVTPLIDAVTDGGEITFDEDIYKFLSEKLGKEIVDDMLNPEALTTFTDQYDFNGTVKDWFDIIQNEILPTLFDGDELDKIVKDFQLYRQKNEYGLEQSRQYYQAEQVTNKVHKAEETPQAMADIALKLKNAEASADDATEAVRRFNLEYTDLIHTADDKWGLSAEGLKKLGLDAQIVSVEDYRDEIAKLKEELLSAQKDSERTSQDEINRLKSLITLREQELKLLNEKNQLVSQNADDYNSLLDAPENYAKNILSYADELKDAAKTGYIEISTLSNIINNLGPASNTVKKLSEQLNVPLLKDGTANIVALTDALYNTKKLATVDGKPMVQIGASMANMLQGAANLDLKDVAQQNIDMLDGMIATLESLKALEDTEIEGGIKMDMLTEATFTDANGNSFESFNALWNKFKETAENDSDLWIDFATHVTADIQTEEGQQQFIDWLLGNETLQQKMGIMSRTVPVELLTKIAAIDPENQDTIDEARTALDNFLGILQKDLQNNADQNPAEINTTTKANTVIEQGATIDNRGQVNDPNGQLLSEQTSSAATAEYYAKKKTATAQVADTSAKITVDADTAPAERWITQLQEKIEEPQTMPLDADNTLSLEKTEQTVQYVEKQHPELRIEGNNSPAINETRSALNYINSSSATLTINGRDNVTSMVDQLVADLNNRTVTIQVNTSSSGSGSIRRTTTPKAYATGTDGAKQAGRALVGELGPEMIVHDGTYSVVGQYGAEFVNIHKDDIVFNASDTARLLKNQRGARGQAFVNGTGPAYASGLDSAINALKEARAAWSSILNSVPDMLKKGSGSGGGGGGSSSDTDKEYLMQLEKWFNWLRRIEELENRITVLRAKRENLKDGKQYADSLYEENAYLKKQSDLYEGLIEEQKAYRKQLQDDYLKNYSKYFYFVGDAIQINAEAILADTKNNEELGEKIQDLIDDYKDVTEQITDNTEKLEENKTQMDENIRTLRDKYIEMENEILDALKNMYQKEIDAKQDALDKMKDADDAYLDSLKKNLDKEKSLREKSKTQEEKQTLQRKIALLSRDTSGKNAKELADLRQQLRDMQEEQYFNDREDAITSAEDATQAQQDALQKEIDNLNEANQIKLDNMQLYWDEVQNIINQGSENILSFLKSYSDNYLEVSKIQQEDYATSWKQTIDAALEYAKDMQKQFDEIIAAATDAVRKSDTGTTGGLLDGSSGSSSSGGSSGGSSGSSGSSKTTSGTQKSTSNTTTKISDVIQKSDVDAVSSAAPKTSSSSTVNSTTTKKNTSSVASKVSSAISSSSTTTKKNKVIKKYASGGLVNYTGIAQVDGTPSKPESFLSAADTNLLANFLKAAHSLELGLSSSSSVRDNAISGAPTVNVDSVEINITQAELKDDADLDKLSQDLSQKFLMDIARQSGNISVSRR